MGIGPLVKRFNHTQPFTLACGVRIPYGHPKKKKNGRLAQLGEHLPYKQRVGGSIPSASTHIWRDTQSGQTGADCKSAGFAFVGSNPTPSTTYHIRWGIAQAVKATDFDSVMRRFESCFPSQVVSH